MVKKNLKELTATIDFKYFLDKEIYNYTKKMLVSFT